MSFRQKKYFLPPKLFPPLFRVVFMFKLILSHCQSFPLLQLLVLKTFISLHLLTSWISLSGKLLKKCYGYCIFDLYFWVILSCCTSTQCFLIFWYLTNIFLLVKLTPCLPCPHPQIPLSLTHTFVCLRIFFKFKKLTGFVLELSIYF